MYRNFATRGFLLRTNLGTHHHPIGFNKLLRNFTFALLVIVANNNISNF